MSGLFFAGCAAALTAGAGVYWFSLVKRVALGEHRWLVNVVMAGGAVLGLLALGQGTGVAGGVLAGASVAVGALYFGLLALAGQSTQRPAVAIGERMPEFTAPDHEGKPFSFASLAGHPVLIKLFRGHW